MSRRFASRLRVAHWLKAFAVHALNVLLGFFLINACTVFCVKFDTCITILVKCRKWIISFAKLNLTTFNTQSVPAATYNLWSSRQNYCFVEYLFHVYSGNEKLRYHLQMNYFHADFIKKLI